MIRRADILAKEEKEYMEKQALKKQKQKVFFSLIFSVSQWMCQEEDDAAQASSSSGSKVDVTDDESLTRAEVFLLFHFRNSSLLFRNY